MAKSFVRPAAAAFVLGLAVAGAPVVQPALVAQADAQTVGVADAIFNKDAKGSIKIKESAEGVTYELFQVQTFASADQLASAAEVTVESALASVKDSQATKTLAGNGQDQTFNDLQVGLYLIKPSHGVHAFLAMIPSTDPQERNKFVYNLEVEPKPLLDSTEKKIVDENGDEVVFNANAGDDIHYQITSSIPKNPNESLYADNEYITKYEVVDSLDTVNLDYKSVKVVVNGEELTETTHYTVSNTVTVTLTGEGMRKLEAAKASDENAKLVVTIAATVKAVAQTDGKVENTATATWKTKNPNDPDGPDSPDVDNPSNPDPDNPGQSTPTTTQWAKIRATKVADVDGGDGLEGAEFALFKCTTADETLDDKNRISFGATKTWTTGENGALVIDGINTEYKHVCLVETKAPEGYELNGKAILIDLTKDLTNVAEGTNPDGSGFQVSLKQEKDIINLASTDANLPLTGGKGVAIFAALAAIVAGASAWFARRFSARA